MVCAMSSASRLRVKVAPNARQPASGDYFASTTRLHTKLTCLEWHNINGRRADTSLHVLEALALFCTRGATELRVGLPVKLNVHKLDEESIQSVLRFLDGKGVLGGLVGQDFPQVVHRLIEAGRHYRSAPELLLSRSDLTGVSQQAQDCRNLCFDPPFLPYAITRYLSLARLSLATRHSHAYRYPMHYPPAYTW